MPSTPPTTKTPTFSTSLLLLTALYYAGWLLGALTALYASSHLFRYSPWFISVGNESATLNNALRATAARSALPALGFALALGSLRTFSRRILINHASTCIPALALLCGCLVTLGGYARLVDVEWSWDFRNSTNLLHMLVDSALLSPLIAILLTRNPAKTSYPASWKRWTLRTLAALATALFLLFWIASSHWVLSATRSGPVILQIQAQRGLLTILHTRVGAPIPTPVAWHFSRDVTLYANNILPGFLGFDWLSWGPGFLSISLPIAAPLLLSLLLTARTWRAPPLAPSHRFEVSLNQTVSNTESPASSSA